MGSRAQQYWENPYVSGIPRRERQSGQFWTYSPSPLRGLRLRVTPETDDLVARAERAVRALNDGAHQDLSLISRFLLRSEAIASSYIEGIAPTPRSVALAELSADEPVRGLAEAAQLVARNMTLVRDASDVLANRSTVDVSDLVSLQESLILSSDLRGIRSTQNWIGGSSYHPLEAAHIPPPAAELPPLLADLVGYLSGAAHSPIIQAALVHAQFETIHPFPDGNGRVGRALIHTVLTRRGLTSGAILPVSLVLATRKDEYIAGLEAFRFVGDAGSPDEDLAVETWIQVFARAVIAAAEQAAALESSLLDLRSSWQELVEAGRREEGMVRAVRSDSALWSVLDSLPGTPVLTTTSVVRMHGVTATAATTALQQLERYGVLEKGPSTGAGRRVWVALDVLGLIASSERQMASRDLDTAISPPVRPVPALPQR